MFDLNVSTVAPTCCESVSKNRIKVNQSENKLMR